MKYNKVHNPALLLINILIDRDISHSHKQLLELAIVYDDAEITRSATESVCYGYIRCLVDNNLADSSLFTYFSEFVDKEFTEHGEYK